MHTQYPLWYHGLRMQYQLRMFHNTACAYTRCPSPECQIQATEVPICFLLEAPRFFVGTPDDPQMKVFPVLLWSGQ